MHHQRDHYIHVSFQSMAERAVARGNDDFEQVCAHRHVSGNPEQIDHRGHSNVARASAKESAEDAADKRDQQNSPERYMFDPRGTKVNHRWELDLVNSFRDMS